mmetsp:Transcript_26531/g.77285  ORF Transcript_26531/g.77285 Transcript_26531/m.77285 type:complete len:293 (-) Transcript_26531:206-1084(-)
MNAMRNMHTKMNHPLCWGSERASRTQCGHMARTLWRKGDSSSEAVRVNPLGGTDGSSSKKSNSGAPWTTSSRQQSRRRRLGDPGGTRDAVVSFFKQGLRFIGFARGVCGGGLWAAGDNSDSGLPEDVSRRWNIVPMETCSARGIAANTKLSQRPGPRTNVEGREPVVPGSDCGSYSAWLGGRPCEEAAWLALSRCPSSLLLPLPELACGTHSVAGGSSSRGSGETGGIFRGYGEDRRRGGSMPLVSLPPRKPAPIGPGLWGLGWARRSCGLSSAGALAITEGAPAPPRCDSG